MHSGYLRYPDVRGDELCFVADDDLWLAPLAGGRASRLTSDNAPATHPRFSPSGGRIAWASSKDGIGDIYVLDRASGAVTRLTYLNGSTNMTFPVAWEDEDHVLITTSALQFDGWMGQIKSVSMSGDLEDRSYGSAMGVAIHPGGAVVINTPCTRDSAMWKRYRGGTASKLWLSPDGSDGWRRVLPDEEAGCYAPAFVGDRLIFSSDIGELADVPQAQLWSTDLSGGDLRQHTQHDAEQGYVRDPRTDGTTIVYHARGKLYAMDGLDGEPRLIDVDVDARRRDTWTDAKQAGTFAPDADATGSLLGWRGAAYYLTHRGGPARALCDVPGVRVREECWLGDTGKVCYVRDHDGVDTIEIIAKDGSGARQIARDELGYIVDLVATPAGDVLGVASHDGRVSLVDVESGAVTCIQERTNGEPVDLTFSPDGRYLAWADPKMDEGSMHSIRVCDLAEGNATIDVTSGTFSDWNPVFTRDGKYLAFLSNRTFDPIYDAHDFDLSFPDATRPYLVTLRADEPSPIGPAADGWALADPKNDDDDPAPEPSCRLDVDGIEDRVIPLPAPVGNYRDLRAIDGGLAWIHDQPTGGTLHQTWLAVPESKTPKAKLERFGFDVRKVEDLVEELDEYEVSGDGRRLVYRLDEERVCVPTDRKVESKDPARVEIDTHRLSRRIDVSAEWVQMARETHRLMRDNYWRADMDGVDWEAVGKTYVELASHALTYADLNDILWEMIAELNTGHCYVRPVGGENKNAEAAFLGAKLHHEPGRGYVIDEILPGEPTDLSASSPLRAPGVAAAVGERIVAVSGQRLDDDRKLGEMLAGTAGKVVELTIASESGERRVAIVPIPGEAKLRYYAWVHRCQRYVEEKSGGRLGYVHVPDMGPAGWAQFYRDIHEAVRHEGVVVDVRFNGGGHTSPLILEKLARRVLGWDIARWYTEPMPYPADAVRGSLVLVTNQFAGSDGDIVNAAAQEMGLAPVIGERTWGGVIGIDGRYDLVDGTGVTQPRYSHVFGKRGWVTENHGVDPDIEVVMTPADWENTDVDIQLDAAIAESLRQLDETPADVAPDIPAPRVG